MRTRRASLAIVFAVVVGTSNLGRSQPLEISEFLAANDGPLLDVDGETSDWVELENRGSAAVNLDGWFLTDERTFLSKWRFPSVVLDAGQRLIVFASGKGRTAEELHTNFRLTTDGEYLALVEPNGVTIAYEFAPTYPRQHDGVSYGTHEVVDATQLVISASPVRYLVPSNDAAGDAWFSLEFDDSDWPAGANGIGFDLGGGVVPRPEDRNNLALEGTASQSSDFNANLGAEKGNDGDFGNFTATESGDLNATWEVKLPSSSDIARVVVHNRGDGCCQSRLRDITVRILDESRSVLYESPLLNSENTLGGGSTAGPDELTVDVEATGRFVQVSRRPDPDLSGTGGAGNTDERNVLSVGEVEVFEGGGGLAAFVETDVESEAHRTNASIYVRIPFVVEDPMAMDSLRLRLRYDAGIVAYLNGQEVFRRNAPTAPGVPPAWNSSATAERDDGDAIASQDVDLSPFLSGLQAGDNVLALHGMNSSASDEDFLVAAELTGLSASTRALRYFENPTPGDPNFGEGLLGFVRDTKFSVDRGIMEGPFSLEIFSVTEHASIRYTTDGRAPTPTSGELYTGPIPIDQTTRVRAIAYLDGFGPTDVDTHTYIFIDDVLQQPTMLRDIVNSETYGPLLREALTVLPTVSLNTERAIGTSVEVKTSVEVFFPDGRKGVQVEAGVKRVGGHSLNAYPKNNMRLYFRESYGDAKLKFPLFEGLRYGEGAVERFDRLNLRSGSHDSIFYLGNNQQPPSQAQYLRNRWISDLQFEMGHLAMHGRFVQLYVNGVYWGHYHLLEHPSQHFFADYLGGEKEDYSVTNSGTRAVGESSLAPWQRLVASARDFTEFQRHADVENYIDYMILNIYAGNDWDWRPNQNWMAGGPNEPDGLGFKFICWDSDIIFRNTADNNIGRGGPDNMLPTLRQHQEFVELFADRAHKHLFGDGVLTPTKVTEGYRASADAIEMSIVAETARWRWGGSPWTRDNQWRRELGRLETDFFPRRPDITVAQLRAANLYPRIDAPVFSRHGGRAELGEAVRITTATSDEIFYTLDGSDPRLPDGGVSPTAIQGGVTDESAILPARAPVRVLVPQDGALGDSWIAPEFDDSSWRRGTTGVGYERSDTFDPLIGTDIEAEAYQTNATVYTRIEFDVVDPGAFPLLFLRMQYDDGFIAYVNGEQVASANAPETPSWDSLATRAHSDTLAVLFEIFDITAHRGLLRQGRNVLAVHGLNSTPSSGDFLIHPELTVAELRNDDVAIDQTMTLKARARAGDSWSALNEAFFHLDVPVRVSEIMYHPANPEEGSSFAADDFEFIELQNVGSNALDLSGFTLAGAVDFEIPDGTRVAPQEVVLVVRSVLAFTARYPFLGANVLGEYRRHLGNAGDTLRLTGAARQPLLEIPYLDSWVPLTDGDGHSLVIIDALAAPEAWSVAGSWKASAEIHGSPGFADRQSGSAGLQIPADLNQDGQLDISDAVNLLTQLFLGGGALPCEGNSITNGGNFALSNVNGDDSVDLTDAVSILSFLFLSGAPPALGIDCVRVEDCPDSCVGP